MSYRKGTYKVAWIGEDPSVLYGKMFQKKEQAIDFANRLDDVMIFQLQNTKNHGYKWNLMEYGDSKQFVKGVKMKRFLRGDKKRFDNVAGVANEMSQSTTSELQKSQLVRLIDVFAIAPVLVYAGTRKELPSWLRYSLIGIGVATFYYNGKNFIVNRKMQK